MKRVIFIVSVVIILISVFCYYKIQQEQIMQDIKQEMQEYNYLDKTISGSELATLMNRGINRNDKNGVEQGEDKAFEITIKFKDSDNLLTMEQLNKAGLSKFVNLYSTAEFKCTNQKQEKDGTISSLYFEEL